LREESPVHLKRCLTRVPRDVSVAEVLMEFRTKIERQFVANMEYLLGV
jgi:heterodisulfide reductase subunit C